MSQKMSSTPKISIIVPVYNAGTRLEKCLYTLINQTLIDIEIILVLDCPTDGSDKLAKEYAKQDERIVIVENEKNLHIGESRNRGLSVAKGEYIGFSDHDDYRELTMYEELYNKTKLNNADIVMSFLENKDEIKSRFADFGENIFTKEFLLKDLIGFGYSNHQGALFVQVNNNLYRNDLIKQNQIVFVDTNFITPEDVLFQIKSIYFASKIDFVRKQFYYHVKHLHNEGSKYSYVSYKKRSAGIAEIYNFLQSKNIFESYKNDFMKGVTKQFINSLSGTLYPIPNLIKFRKAVKHLRSYPFCKEAFESYSLPPVKNNLFRRFLVERLRQ